MLFLFSSIGYAEEIFLTDVPSDVFVNGGRTDFDAIINQEDVALEVEQLFKRGVLFHDYTLEIHPNSNFKTYWSVFQKRWFAVDLNNDGVIELIMIGKVTAMEEKEYLEIWVKDADDIYQKNFAEVGKPLAYKFQPNTGEIVLFHHRYPCCYSASHNIIELRLLNGKIKQRDRYFLGRDDGKMVGPFYPDKVNYTDQVNYLKVITPVYWSPAVVEQHAFPNYTETNLIIHYNAGATYHELHRENDWAFVLLHSGIMEEPSMVINALNFIHRPVYGWIMIDD
jgi:hypothetical protein